MADARRFLDACGGKVAVRRERALAGLAAGQYGVVSLGQLVAIGFSPRAVSRRVQSGRLHRLHRGVYAAGHPCLTLHGRWLAATLAGGEGVVLSHRSAAHLRKLIDRSGAVEMTSSRKLSPRRGVVCRLSGSLAQADRAVVDAIPCASVPLTLLGLAATAPATLPGALARAERRGRLDLSAIAEMLGRRPRTPGSPALRRALRAYRVEWEWTRGELERRAPALFGAAGMPRPDVNTWIAVAGDGCEVDFSWPSLRLAIEADGWETHGDRRAFEEDRRRDAALVAAGWRVLRFTWRQVVHEPEAVVAILRQLTEARATAGRRSHAR